MTSSGTRAQGEERSAQESELDMTSSGVRTTTIGHIVNPVAAGESSDLFVAQPVTFETMRQARAAAGPGLEISFFSAQYAEDRDVVPAEFVLTPDLERSARDLVPGDAVRNLPLCADICDRLYEASDADYLVYTNVDIALKPDFYTAVAGLIGQGFDALAFTRRNISGRFTSVAEIREMYVAEGKSQRGPDCFVFQRELYPQFDFADVFTGEPGVGRVILANLLRYGQRPGFFTDGALTFHIGNEGGWRLGENPSRRANLERSLTVVEKLSRDADEERRELIRPHLEAIERMLERMAPVLARRRPQRT